eukprot:14503612-Heterocapsa_arctica.AAC.1
MYGSLWRFTARARPACHGFRCLSRGPKVGAGRRAKGEGGRAKVRPANRQNPLPGRSLVAGQAANRPAGWHA